MSRGRRENTRRSSRRETIDGWLIVLLCVHCVRGGRAAIEESLWHSVNINVVLTIPIA